ncbi:hypothetical protein, partial [Cupriavidus sp. BIS7]|uniref:hypothetical protein n=1 Tax=Cupriavidus sp. BIS7 TaxID=1217718 RepID=UPI00035E0FDA
MSKTLLTSLIVATAALVAAPVAHAQDKKQFDPYTQGAKTDKYNPYTDGARAGDKFDPYSQGANTTTQSDLAPTQKADPYTDGAKASKYDPYTDGA